MSFGDVIKGVGWVAGKVLQGTAWVASEVIREGTGVDIYGSVKDGIQNADDANESIDNIYINLMNQGDNYDAKRKELLYKAVKQASDAGLQNYNIYNLKNIDEMRILQKEAKRRGIEIEGLDELIEESRMY